MASPTLAAPPRSIDPTTGRILAEHPYLAPAEIESRLALAERATGQWRRTPLAARAHGLRNIGALLRRDLEPLASTITAEMGKPIAEARAEVEKSAWNCEHVAAHGEAWLADEPVPTNAASSYVSCLPLGAILAIMPWNFPVWQVFRCAAGALMGGNVVLLKHAPNVLGCAAHIETLVREAGLPPGVFQHLNVPVEAVSALIADARIAAVTLTGSPRAGTAVAAQAGAACKKSILELGGSDAFIVLEDADLDLAADAAVRGRFANCGQVCLAAKRFLVVEAAAEEFERRFVARVEALRVGAPHEAGTQIGPMAREDLRLELDTQVRESLALGARPLAGARMPAGAGWFYEPTVLAGARAGMPAWDRETFGPVAALARVGDPAQAVELANHSPYGLSAVIWTRDLARARGMARELAVGSVFVNGVTASDPRLPVGGVKLSGYGRELGRAGIRELVNLQSVWIGPARA